jgi:hypothetical protein
LPCLVFVAPLLLIYELGVSWFGGEGAAALRTGADAWLRQGLAGLGLTDHWLLPVGLVVGLVAWQAFEPRGWRFAPSSLLAMWVESLVLAVALVGLSKVVDVGLVWLEHSQGQSAAVVAVSPSQSRAVLLGFLGAGIYEEALFRLTLVPVLFGLARVLQVPALAAATLAVTGSALLFSLAHHAGTPTETFAWFTFIFRWLAGVYFAGVFMVRGFGIAVGTHTLYDILVGWLGWHF